MQEVDKETIRSRGIDVSAYMAQKIFPSYSHSHFAANVSFRKGEYGNAVVTNIGVIKTQEVKFTKTRREQRGAVATKLSFGNGKFLWFVNCHLQTIESDALKEAKEMVDWIKTFDRSIPTIVVGDFSIVRREDNKSGYDKLIGILSTPDLPGFKEVCPDVLTFKENRQFDFMFVYDGSEELNFSCKAIRQQKGTMELSDHSALVAKFHWQ